jgi:hypothetical protein
VSDDALIRANEQEIFEAIVSQTVDPELTHLRRLFLVLGAGLFVLGALAVTAGAGFGWAGFCAFCATFVPGLLLARRAHLRRLAAALHP